MITMVRRFDIMCFLQMTTFPMMHLSAFCCVRGLQQYSVELRPVLTDSLFGQSVCL